MKSKYVELYEEFNSYGGFEFVNKLVIYAKASEYVKDVSEISTESSFLKFIIFSTIPADNGKLTNFEVSVPIHAIDDIKIKTVVDTVIIRTDKVSPSHENERDVILVNFIEICNLYNDSVVTSIVDAYDSIKNPEDIKNIIKGKN